MSEIQQDTAKISLQVNQQSTVAERVAQTFSQKKYYWLALVLLVVILLGVFFYLPQVAKTPNTVNIDDIRHQAIQRTKVLDESPWQQAQQAKYRQQAQKILAQVIEYQTSLEQKQVQLWHKDAFNTAVEHAQLGDQLYREQHFTQAITQYQQALSAMQQLIAKVPEIYAHYLAQAKHAIANQQVNQAIALAQIALYLQPDEQQAQQTMYQAEALQQVLNLVQRGDDLIKENQLDQAKALFEQAVERDPYSSLAKQRLQKVQKQIVENKFSALMSEGYQQLANRAFSKALSRFNQAKHLAVDDTQAKEAIAQVKSEQKAFQLNQLLQQARDFEQQEQWVKAQQMYQQMLAIDSSIVSAKVGNIKANARAKLSQKLQKIIDKPLALADLVAFEQANKVLVEAQKIQQRGPVLQAQITQVNAILAQLKQPITVYIKSDNATQVKILRVSDLGQFVEKNIELTPGQYTFIGSKRGFKDVQKNLTLSLASPPVALNIICTEKVGG